MIKMTGFILAIVAANTAYASTTKIFSCENTVLKARITIEDLGHGYANGQFFVRARKNNKVVLQGKEKKQNYFVERASGWPTYKYLFGYNPNGGGYSQPLMSIWMTTDDVNTHTMVYYREPYYHEDLNCVKLR